MNWCNRETDTHPRMHTHMHPPNTYTHANTRTHTEYMYIHLFLLLFSSLLDNPTASYLSARLCSCHPQSCPPPRLHILTHTHRLYTPHTPQPPFICWWAQAPLLGHSNQCCIQITTLWSLWFCACVCVYVHVHACVWTNFQGVYEINSRCS